MELFHRPSLQFDITEHKYYVPHTKLSKEEGKKLKDKYGITNFPSILTTDAISRYFNFRKGEVIKIERKDGTIIYRVVK